MIVWTIRCEKESWHIDMSRDKVVAGNEEMVLISRKLFSLHFSHPISAVHLEMESSYLVMSKKILMLQSLQRI